MQQKKKRRRRLNYKNIFIIIGILTIIISSFNYFNTKKISNIYITGNTITKDVDIIRRAKIEKYPAIFKLSKNKIEEDINKSPLIEETKVTKNLLGKLTIEVKESVPLFYYDSLKEVTLSNNESIEYKTTGLPTLINYVPNDVLENFVDEFKIIKKDIRSSINEIEYSPSKNKDGKIIDDTRFILKMNDQNTVEMNILNIEKLNKYLEIFSVIESERPNDRGTLKLDSSTDAFTYVSYSIQEEEKEEDTEKDE